MGTWTVYRCSFISRRSLATIAKAVSDSKTYSKTLLLPKTTFPQWTDPLKSEKPFRKKTTQDLYEWQENNLTGPLFVLHDGPPYANGNLHMGHALNKILKDIINRFHVLQGRKVNYIPGWDCHGLPIEVKALKELRKDAHNLPRAIIRTAAKSVAEREIQTQLEEFQEFGIMADWSTTGTYRTLDKQYELRQLHVFHKMVENGLIYRNYRPVHYSPSSRSALAESELNYRDDHVSRSVYVLFRLDAPSASALYSKILTLCSDRANGVHLMVWTTTPWTLTANMAIAINPVMEYVAVEAPGKKTIIVGADRLPALQKILGPTNTLLTLTGNELLGFVYRPLFSKTLSSLAPFSIIPASHVTSGSGTGLVHCAPAHGAEDYKTFRDLNLLDTQSPESLICHVDEQGKYDKRVCDVVGTELGEKLVGLDVLEKGAAAIIDLLEEKALLVKEEKITHRYPYDWKTDKPIIVTATSQWFTNLESLREEALIALKDVAFYPPESRNRLESFIRSRSEWCISRQRAWGVPIPSLHHVPTGRAILTARSLAYILSVLEEKGVEHWWKGIVTDFVPSYLREEFCTHDEGELERVWKKGTDTMDVWFDSGSSWAMLRDRGVHCESTGRGAYADVCLEGSDQHRGWFQSMLLTATATAGGLKRPAGEAATLPYRSVITHGMVLDQEGKKMSKSIGNVISPMSIVRGGKNKQKDPAYGADVLRFWAASIEMSRDSPLGPTVLAQAAESLRKIRNTARFILGNIGNFESRKDLERVDAEDMNIADRYVMKELLLLEDAVLIHYNQFNFSRVVQAISRFTSSTLSALYFDISKDVLYASRKDSVERRAVVTVLEQVLDRLIFMMAPITPHLAEEIFYHNEGAVGDKYDGPSVFTKQWVPLSSSANSQVWSNKQVECDAKILLAMRDSVLGLLEQSRGEKGLRSSLEADLDIIIPSSDWLDHDGELQRVMRSNRDYLKTLFIVSDVSFVDEGSLGLDGDGWVYSSSMDAPGLSDESLGLRIRPASRSKCPRCWAYTRHEERDLCDRCSEAIL